MLWDFLKHRMEQFPYKILSDEHEMISYQELIASATKIALQLNEPCYGILCHSELHTAQALLSCFAAGIPAVPLSYRYGTIHCEKIIQSIGIGSLLTDEEGIIKVEKINPIRFRQKTGMAAALIMCTSGTTGTPKGTMISEQNLLSNLKDIEAYFQICSNDRIVIARPLYHCAVLTGEFLISLIKGLNIYFYNGNFNPQQLFHYLNETKATVLCGTPTLFYHLGRIAGRQKGALTIKTAVTSGECMTPTVANNMRKNFPDTAIYNVYGLTEASPRVAWLPPDQFDSNPISVGYPLASIKARIVDEQSRNLPANTDGELIIAGPNVMLGYYNHPKATLKTIQEGWLHTGDIASMDEQGRITVKCRKDNMIIRAGMNIYPQEIENTLKQDKSIADVLVIGTSGDNFGQKILLRIVPEADTLDQREVMAMCKTYLPSYQWPDKIEIVSDLPKNGSGKVLRPKLAAIS